MKKLHFPSLIALAFSAALISGGSVLAAETSAVQQDPAIVTSPAASGAPTTVQKDSEQTDGSVATDDQARTVHTNQKAGKVGKDAAGDGPGNPDYPRGLPTSKTLKK